MTDKCTVDLETIQPGQQVAWLDHGHYEGTRVTLGTVARLTPTQIVVDVPGARLPYRFHRTDGKLLKSYGVYLKNPLDGDVVNARAARRARQVIGDLERGVRGRKIRDAIDAVAFLDAIQDVVDTARNEVRTMLTRLDATTTETP